jgi:hypothetical protein
MTIQIGRADQRVIVRSMRVSGTIHQSATAT